jgi:hypothetical protein
MWAQITYERGQSERDAIEKWYYSTGSETTGDFALSSFDYVFCVKTTSSATSFTIPAEAQDPFVYAFFIVYHVRETMREITIVGGLYWKDVTAKNLISSLVHSRSFLPPYDDAMDVDEPTPKMFLFPTTASKGVLSDTDAVHARVDYYLGLCDTLNDSFSPQDELEAIHMMHFLGRSMEHTFSIPGTSLDMSVIRERWHRIYLSIEYIRLKELWPKTERQLMDVLLYNGFGEEASIFPPPAFDQRDFALRWPGCAPPSCYFAVPMVELPLDLAMHLHIYPGGLVHISYMDMFDWIWNLFVIQSQLKAFDSTPIVLEKDDWRYHLRHRIVMWLSQHSENALTRKEGGGGWGGGRAVGLEGPTYVIEKNDLLSLVPPCFKRIMEQREFMKNAQRIHWVSTMQFAGVSRESIASFLESMNEAFPKGHRTAKARFDYDYVLNKRSGPTFCANIVQNRDSNSITCPFAEEVGPIHDVEDLANACKCKCAPNERAFRGPAALIARAIRRTQRQPVLVEETLPQPGEEELESESSSE